MNDRDAATAALGRPELARLWLAARHRLERNGRAITAAPIRLDDLSPAEVDAVCGLLGVRRPADGRIRVSLAVLDTALLKSALGGGVIATLEVLSGPVVDRRAERAEARGERETLWRTAHGHPAASDATVQRWLEALRRRGRLAKPDLVDPAVLVERTLDLVGWLLVNRADSTAAPVPLAVLASDRLGDAHALDADTALGALAFDAVCVLSESNDARRAWATFGVQLDRLSSSALAFMLPGMAESLSGTAARTGEPLRVTHRMIDRGFGLASEHVGRVWICENPAIVSVAADRLGTRCAPLVCLEGMPGTAAIRLLTALRTAGASLAVHTDFDLGGLAIASHVIARFGATPWRLGTADYLAALTRPSIALGHTIGETPWDLHLGPTMNERRRAVHEESIVDMLLDDLRLD